MKTRQVSGVTRVLVMFWAVLSPLNIITSSAFFLMLGVSVLLYGKFWEPQSVPPLSEQRAVYGILKTVDFSTRKSSTTMKLTLEEEAGEYSQAVDMMEYSGHLDIGQATARLRGLVGQKVAMRFDPDGQMVYLQAGGTEFITEAGYQAFLNSNREFMVTLIPILGALFVIVFIPWVVARSALIRMRGE